MIRSIYALTFLALTVTSSAFGANATPSDAPTGDVRAAASAETRGDALFANVREDHFRALVDRVYDGAETRGMSALDHARVRQIAVATAIFEVLYEEEATYDEVFGLAVQQAQNEGSTLDFVAPNEVPEVMRAENPVDALLWQHDLLGALESLHQQAWTDLMNRVTSQWPGMTQDLIDRIMGAMLFNGGEGSIKSALKAAAHEYLKKKLGEEEYECVVNPQNFAVGECAEIDNEGLDPDEEVALYIINSCFDRPTFYYASDKNTMNALLSVTIRVEQNIDRLTTRAGLPRR